MTGALGSIKKSANELGYSKDLMAQLDTAQAKTIERLKALRQGPVTPKVITPESEINPPSQQSRGMENRWRSPDSSGRRFEYVPFPRRHQPDEVASAFEETAASEADALQSIVDAMNQTI